MPPPGPPPFAYPLPEAARLSGLSPATLRRRASDGHLRLIRVGRRTLIDGPGLRRLLGQPE